MNIDKNYSKIVVIHYNRCRDEDQSPCLYIIISSFNRKRGGDNMRYIHIVPELHEDEVGKHLIIIDTGKIVKIYDLVDLFLHICKFFKGAL